MCSPCTDGPAPIDRRGVVPMKGGAVALVDGGVVVSDDGAALHPPVLG
jgi:hypothetical protein